MSRLRDEGGAVVPIVVLSLIALFGMVVLTVDVGGLLVKRRAMVNASDSAALAAAQSYSLGIEAQCGTNDGPAQAKANFYADQNVSGATPTSFSPDCANQNVEVAYKTNQDLFFAGVLGFGSDANVGSTATAHWGPTVGGTPMPVELDPLITDDCVYQGGDPSSGYNDPQTCPEGYWFNNQDLTGSGWGLMNLNTWNVDPGASCDNSGGASDLSNWILQEPGYSTYLSQTSPAYVCTTDGGKTSDWLNALQQVAGNGEAYLFPINDPSQMIYGPPTSQEKYAIVAFVPLKVVAVYDVGKDTDAAIGGSFTCVANDALTPNQSVDLSSEPLTGLASSDCSAIPRDAITSLKVSPASGGTAYKAGADYDFDGKVLTWKKAPTNVKLSFDYRSGGICPGHSPDPNAYCLQLAWDGQEVIGVTDPNALGTGPAMAVQLVK